jgi:hypothetical protein
MELFLSVYGEFLATAAFLFMALPLIKKIYQVEVSSILVKRGVANFSFELEGVK